MAVSIKTVNQLDLIDSGNSLDAYPRQCESVGMGHMIFETLLHKIDPAQNMARYYSISIQPNLFGGHSLLRRWGRIGSSSQIKIDLFENETSAADAREKLVLSKLRRGYLPVMTGSPGSFLD